MKYALMAVLNIIQKIQDYALIAPKSNKVLEIYRWRDSKGELGEDGREI